MMLSRKRNRVLLALTVLAGFSGCTKVWDNHDKTTDPNLKNNLYQAISQTTGLSKFSQLLVKTGYDKIISSSKTYTVWAPNDQALQSLDAAILNDTAKLKQFVGNHIANQSYLAGAGTADQRVQMLNGKYNNATGTSFDSAAIVTANSYATNGVFHVINKFIPRYDNCWEFMQNTTLAPMMKSRLLSFSYSYFDSTKAIQIGVDPNTGRPIWDSTNGKIQRNHFLDTAYDIRDESAQYTFVMITDAGYATELAKLEPYFKTASMGATDSLAGMHMVKDFVFKGVYSPAQLPSALVSKFGVSVPMTPANIVGSYKTSNGIVYLMSDVTFQFSNKFPSIVIQGEYPYLFAADRTANTFYRVRKDSLGNVFNDIYLQNYNAANYWILYFAYNVYSTKYNVSWVAVNDVQSTPLWQQRLAIDSFSNTANFPYGTIPYLRYAEQPLGQWTASQYRGALPLYVVGPTTASSTGGNNSITLDYIKLTPLP